jgi:hypothetical protein
VVVGLLLALTYFALKHFASPATDVGSDEDETRKPHAEDPDEEWPEEA